MTFPLFLFQWRGCHSRQSDKSSIRLLMPLIVICLCLIMVYMPQEVKSNSEKSEHWERQNNLYLYGQSENKLVVNPLLRLLLLDLLGMCGSHLLISEAGSKSTHSHCCSPFPPRSPGPASLPRMMEHLFAGGHLIN